MGRSSTEVLGDGAVQVLHGGTGCHGDNPVMTEGLSSSHAGAGVRGQQTLDKVLCQVGHGGPGLCVTGRQERVTDLAVNIM